MLTGSGNDCNQPTLTVLVAGNAEIPTTPDEDQINPDDAEEIRRILLTVGFTGTTGIGRGKTRTGKLPQDITEESLKERYPLACKIAKFLSQHGMHATDFLNIRLNRIGAEEATCTQEDTLKYAMQGFRRPLCAALVRTAIYEHKNSTPYLTLSPSIKNIYEVFSLHFNFKEMALDSFKKECSVAKQNLKHNNLMTHYHVRKSKGEAVSPNITNLPIGAKRGRVDDDAAPAAKRAKRVNPLVEKNCTN